MDRCPPPEGARLAALVLDPALRLSRPPWKVLGRFEGRGRYALLRGGGCDAGPGWGTAWMAVSQSRPNCSAPP